MGSLDAYFSSFKGMWTMTIHSTFYPCFIQAPNPVLESQLKAHKIMMWWITILKILKKQLEILSWIRYNFLMKVSGTQVLGQKDVF